MAARNHSQHSGGPFCANGLSQNGYGLCFEGIVLEPCLLQPCFHVAGRSAPMSSIQMLQLRPFECYT